MNESLTLDMKKDGLWLVAKTKDGRGGALHLDTVIRNLHREGIIRGIFIDALGEMSPAQQEVGDD